MELERLLPGTSNWVVEEKCQNTFTTTFPSPGSILGVTKMVDMRFTKKYGNARVRVAVQNPGLIPELVDIVIGEYVYKLRFRVEREDNTDNPTPLDMDIDPDRDDDKTSRKRKNIKRNWGRRKLW
uniref:DUF4283 domain-containing protein n=1 Tax=Setaria italica TaxID=4555 RepID=K3YLG3_SETIT